MSVLLKRSSHRENEQGKTCCLTVRQYGMLLGHDENEGKLNPHSKHPCPVDQRHKEG